MSPEQQRLINKITQLFEFGPEFEQQARIEESRFKQANPGINIPSCETESYLRKFLTQDKEMLELKNDIRKCALVNDTILIQGETGTGKELLARALHGSRIGKFVAINCTSLPDELLESELFGHKRGAFTGAIEDKPGLLQTAVNGTMFLDEIGDMPLNLQAKLLRALQDKHGRRLGANEEYEFNCRIVCATNQNIWDKGFRNDLYHRISTITLQTKPLRKRIDDIELIVNSLCSTFPSEFVWYDTNIHIDHLQGNVRSIQKIVRRWEVLGRMN